MARRGTPITRMPAYPHPAFFRGIVLRSAAVWAGLRGFLLFLGLTIPAIPNAIAIVALTAWLTTRDGLRHGETVLLANLGVPGWRLGVVAAIAPAICESLIRIVA